MGISRDWEQFFDKQSVAEKLSDSKFDFTPVTSREFFDHWMKQPLYPEQQLAIDQVFTEDYQDMNTSITELQLYWGESCFTGDTSLSLLNGQEVSFSDLVRDYSNHPFWVYSSTPDGEIRAGKAFNPRITKYVTETIKVTLDNGKTFECTLDHPFMTREGRYIQASELKVEDTLMPLYRKYSRLTGTSSNYELTYVPKYQKYVPTHRLIKSRRGKVTHHRDFNSRNNSPDNLQIMTFKQHQELHQQTTQLATEACKLVRLEQPELWEKWVKARHTTQKSSKYRQRLSRVFKQLYQDHPEKIRQLQQITKTLWQDPNYRQKVLSGVEQYYQKSTPEFNEFKIARSKKSNQKRWGKSHQLTQICPVCLQQFESYQSEHRQFCSRHCKSEAQKLMYLNHVVTHIEYKTYPIPIPMYDITVEKYHNFALTAGVITHNSGKDFFTTRLMVYLSYWLICLKSPQKYLGTVEGTPIDIANTSVNEAHASDVFFKQFCEALKLVINPSSGLNWFEEQGMDLRDGKDILNTKVRFPKNITAHSLNSIKYAGEGKNILLGVLDEIAEFRYDRAKALYSNLKNTALSRFPKHHKLVLISYLRDEFDFMNTHFNEVDSWPEEAKQKVYRSKKCTWEVNLGRTKEDYRDAYQKDPEDAGRRFENKISERASTKFIREPIKILRAVRDLDKPEGSPIIGETPYWTEDLNDEVYAAWFKPHYTREIAELEELYIREPSPSLKEKIDLDLDRHKDGQYFIHIDLAKGVVDYAGFALVHPYKKTPSQIGYYVDLLAQLRPKGKEINFEDIRKFIFWLQDKRRFEIAKVTLDGFSSVDFQQILERKGIACDIVSVDRTMKPYSTLKDILYQELLSMYYNPIIVRELTELIVEGHKVDHPRESLQRLKDEQNRYGSKDLADALAGAVFQAVTYGDAPDAYVSIGDQDPKDILDRFFQ